MAAFCKNCFLSLFDDSYSPTDTRRPCPRCGSTERRYSLDLEKPTGALRQLRNLLGKDQNHFIGRRDELDQLSNLINSAKGVISVIGEPGVGKTALVNELLRRNPHVTPLWLTGKYFDGDEIENELLRQIHISSPAPLVVVIDEADRLQETSLQLQLKKATEFGRVSNVIVTSNKHFTRVDVDFELQLAPLSGEDFLEWSESQNGLVYDLGKEAESDRIIEVIKPDIIVANNTLIEQLRNTPHDLFNITPRQLEELVAELLNNQGFDVELTKQTRDDGVDIFAYKKLAIGRILFVVDTKRYKKANLIGVEMVRQLHGTLIHHNATSAMLVTTSGYSRDSRKYEKQHAFQLFLREYADIIGWLNDYKKLRTVD